MTKLTPSQMREIRALAKKSDSEIDFSDAPLTLDWSRAEIGKFYRPKKEPVTIRLDSDIVAWLKSSGPGYQTKANALLRHAMTNLMTRRKPKRASRTRSRAKK